MMDWMGKLLGLPEQFLNCTEGHGGGVLQVLKTDISYQFISTNILLLNTNS